MNISEFCGNAASILTLTAYTMTDMMELRITAICATILSLTFQYYRAVPLWIPIRWNGVLLFLNLTMVSTLYLERRRAQQMSPNIEELYDKGQFQSRGFSRVEFLRLHDLASTVTLEPGKLLVKEGEVKDALFFLVDGSVHITKKPHPDKVVAQLEPYHFLGEISLLSRMAASSSQAPAWESTATANVVVSSKEPAVFLEWKFDQLIPFLQEDRAVRNALSAFINHDLTSKLSRDDRIQKLQRSTSIAAQPVETVESEDNTAQSSRAKVLRTADKKGVSHTKETTNAKVDVQKSSKS